MTDRWEIHTPPDEKRVVSICRSLVFRGELTGSQDLVIEGQVDGKIDLPDHDLTTGPESRIHATISAKAVVVRGELSGDIAASEKVELTETSRVTGDIIAPLLTIADGACLKGAVDISGVRGDSMRQEPSTESDSMQPKMAPRTQRPMSTLPRREFRNVTS
jgi:cytoskeletal protein CcmA (bactofilin family)